ncbi:Transposon TX1 uncharacterized 149 kDa protein [Vitis vinifera]|uniref:Transposon TX1 uncharacterized 149 kDa protein n=1 Tax=Vitis vinifera TaxID=29760 RepID=A0A438CZW6_VITVI|nr:Transposon TX1 uncharacterized 149 kDa protein [Vitis vinifera]
MNFDEGLGTMKCKVEKFEVEKKSFQVKFEGSNGGTWVSVTERSRGFDVSVGFGREEVVWLTEHLKKAVELENTRGFTRKFRGENKIHLMEICFNNRGRFMKITEIATRRNPLLLVIPEGDKGSGWEVLRRAIISVQDYSDQVGEERKKMFGNNQLSKSRYRGGRSYAEVVAEDGIRSGVPLAAGKWARAVICECKEKVQDWTDEGKAIASRKSKMVTRAGEAFSERKACSPKKMVARENMFIPGKFRRGWLVLKGLPFHLWEVDQLKFILKKWGRVTEVARETVKLLDLTKVKLWVEMHPRVVLQRCSRWKTGPGNILGCVSQTPKFAEGLRGSIRGNECYRRELLPRARYRRSSTSMAAKRENGWEGSRLGLVEEVILGPTGPESSTKAHPVRAQKGRRSRGLHAGPDVPQAHDAAASLSSPQRAGSSAKATTQPRSGDERGRRSKSGEDGRADEFRAQISSNPSPPSEIEEESYGRRTVGCKSSGPSGLGQVQGGSMSSGLRYGSRERESAARKGKAPMDQKEDFTQGEKTMDSREMWSKLFLPSADRRHGQRSSSETLPLRSAASFSEGHNLEVDGGMGSHQTRGIRESPIFRCLLPRNCNSWSKEETSTSRGVMESRKSQLKEDKGGFTGRAGSGSGKLGGDVGPLNFVGIPVHVEEENQRAVFNQMSESSTPGKSSNLMPGSPGVNEASPPEDFLIDGLSPRKMAKETKKEKCDRRLVGSVWTVRNKDWVILPACGASGGILFIWDSKKLSKEEVVLGSFSISVKFALEGCGPLWISAVYGPNSPSLRKDFWVELYDIYGLTFPLCYFPKAFKKPLSEGPRIIGQLLWIPIRSRNGWEGHKFMRRLQFVKAKAKEWNKLSFGVLNEKKKSILKDLANLDAIEQDGGLTSELLGQRALRKGELEELILREEIHWRQKARVKWVKEGDCNSKFFHKVANGRRNRKYIKSLENETGLVLNNAVSITEEILLYFEKLYANPIGESWSIEGLDWSPISEESAISLVAPFTEEEISKAIFQMDRDKAPGPDGFTIAVFQDCWDVIKEDLVRVFAEFHRSGVINQSTNASFIVLLPKKRRLRGVLHETIHSTQGAFVQGRQIMDAVLIANEIVDERRRSGEEGVVFKIDFEKAYDHVRWDFLDQVLEKKGFSPKWRKWMNGCLSSVSYAVLVNGSAKADVLSRMLVRAEERNMLEGFRVGRNRTRVSHLQFADDTIFFSNTREEDLQTLKSLLLAFGHISGLKLPASIAAKIERLQRDFLWSGIGEGKKDHLVRWDVVCKPKEIGGLGFGNISLRNLALLGKWLWRYPREGSALWHQVILSIYGSHSNGWDANTIVRWSHRCPWKAISQVFQEFSSFTRFVVGNGERIRFWEDLWWGDQPLGSQYPSLFRVVLDKNIPISSVLGPTRPFSWNLNFRRNLSDSEIEDLEGLMRSLDGVHLSPSVPDARLWPLSSSGLFSVKSFFLALSQFFGSPQVFPSKFVWNSQIPFKVQSFIWLVAHKKVNTNDMLQVRRPYKALSPDICILCMKHGESADHIFLHCSLTIGLWHRLFQLAKMDWVPPRSILDMMYIKFNGFGSTKRGIALWQAANIALIRIVWRERNARIFEDKTRNSESLWDSIVFLASLWAYCSKVFKGTPLNALHLDWIAQEDEVGVVEVEVVGCSELHLLVSRLLGNLVNIVWPCPSGRS